MPNKPEFFIERANILKKNPEFQKKQLCDGWSMSSGDACAYGCSYCYVGSMFSLEPKTRELRQKNGLAHGEMQIRRNDPTGILLAQLHDSSGVPRYKGQSYEGKVIYCSPIVDCAATPELARETANLCKLILRHTSFHVRLLSKSSFLPIVAKALEDVENARQRMIFGCSTGTLDDKLAASFECGTARVSKRLASIHALSRAGWRVFGMLCPALPGTDIPALTAALPEAVESVWGEGINLRGKSFPATIDALRGAGFNTEADALSEVCGSGSKARWEQYCRTSFEALADCVPTSKLRWLQYVTDDNRDWWEACIAKGAICL